MCCPRGVVELTRCLSHPGHEQGLNKHAFLEREEQWGTVSFFGRNSCLRASTPYEICGFFEVSRSSIIAFLNLAECDMQCSDNSDK